MKKSEEENGHFKHLIWSILLIFEHKTNKNGSVR